MCDKVVQGEGGSKLAKNSVIYFMDGPLVTNANEYAYDTCTYLWSEYKNHCDGHC